jgi:uncharacterized protein (TIGR03067 family)
MKHSFALALVAGALTLALSLTPTPATAAEEGFQSLFNGKDLTGWTGDAGHWSVQDGAITGVTKAEPKLTHNTFLVYTNGDVSDFELRLSYRIVKGNSGIQYRSRVLRQGDFGPIVGGYQADFEAGKTYSGILYEEQGRGILAQRGQKTVIKDDGEKHKVEVVGEVGKSEEIQAGIKNEDWNDYVVIAQGNHLQHFINGKPTVDVVDESALKAAKAGVLALQVHTGPPMTVQFKNIRIKKLSGGSASTELQKLQGVWEVVRSEANGETISAEESIGLTVTISDLSYSVAKSDGTDRGRFTLNSGAEPKQMDVSPDTGPVAGMKLPAIYEFAGETLRICYAIDGGSRPTAFSANPDSGRLLVTYKKKS